MASPKTMPLFEGKRRTAKGAIRAFCLWCCGGSSKEVGVCPSGSDKRHPCDLWHYRNGGPIPPGVSRSLLKAIKARCLDCLPGSEHTPKDCTAYEPYAHHPACPLWPFRLGRNPNIGVEQRKKLRAHGKEKGFKTGSQAKSGSRIAPNPHGEAMPHDS